MQFGQQHRLSRVGREPLFPKFAESRRRMNCACRRRNALRRQSPKAAVGQKPSIKRGSNARGVQRDRLDLDAYDLSLLRFLEHRVERVGLGPAVYWRVDSVRNGSPRVDGSFGHARIDAQV